MIRNSQRTSTKKWFENNSWVLGSEYVRRIPTREIDLHSTADILLVSIEGFVVISSN